MVVAAKVGEFQGRLTPNYSVTLEDALKDPWEVFISIKDVPIEQGFHPLSVEIAALLMFSDICILKSLRAKMIESQIGFTDGTDGDIPSENMDAFVQSASLMQDLRRLRMANNSLGSGVIGGRDKKGRKFVKDFKKKTVVSDNPDTDFSGAEGSYTTDFETRSETSDALP